MDTPNTQHIIPMDIERQMKSAFIDYSMSVIVSRALPDVRDGMKPVHRRILYSMYNSGLTPDKNYSKSAATAGDVIKYFHESEYMRILQEAYNNEAKADFYSFTRSLDALKESLTGENKTVMLDKDSELARILYGDFEG